MLSVEYFRIYMVIIRVFGEGTFLFYFILVINAQRNASGTKPKVFCSKIALLLKGNETDHLLSTFNVSPSLFSPPGFVFLQSVSLASLKVTKHSEA